ncbi:hypothetical protein ACIBF5_25685 [Micromonospora sp. NPDC050417]|uniref:hypothetical protein n=1 Tax=Micromonospora sp. NPDC050417 TaxID=3364280 RepID=UPI0037AFC507
MRGDDTEPIAAGRGSPQVDAERGLSLPTPPARLGHPPPEPGGLAVGPTDPTLPAHLPVT